MSRGSASGVRVILHADMDAFYAAIEQRDRPELRGLPVIVGGTGRRGVVSTCSYEARRFGVHSAMPGAVARRLCPQAVFLPPRMEVYAEESKRVRRVFDQFTPLVEPLSLDEAFLDVTGSQRLFGDGETTARCLKQEVRAATGLNVSVGVAPNKYAAKVASDLDKPDGLVVVPPGGVVEFLAPLPVARLWGAGKVTQERLKKVGLNTIGDLQALSLTQLQDLLGERAGAHFHALARGDDPRPVESERGAKSLSHETTFHDDVKDREECHRVLFELSEMVGRRLRRQELACHTVRIKVRHGDFTTFSRQRRLPFPTADDLVLNRTAVEMFDELWPGHPGLRLLGVAAAEIVDANSQQQRQLFDNKVSKSNKLLSALDNIRDRFGDEVIKHGGASPHSSPRGTAEPL